ncbi:hypothetical protein TUM3794_13810 [Shewanella colwelliana]|uniref:Fumarate lyase N-terminal domain-containing protein n=1 Tax=Shewanella colwelliana TaxID=23 RepID=A0ABQ4NXL0_SHECO|nr:hypothetical protein TUM3794_13810 [Shewanella colwelliana]
MVFLVETIQTKALQVDDVVKIGRTHLMDAMPVRMSQVLDGWASQIEQCIAMIQALRN